MNPTISQKELLKAPYSTAKGASLGQPPNVELPSECEVLLKSVKS